MNIEVKVEKQFGEHKKGKTLKMHKSTAESLVKKGLVSYPESTAKALETTEKETNKAVKEAITKAAAEEKAAEEAKAKKKAEAKAKLDKELKEAGEADKKALKAREVEATERAKNVEIQKALAIEKQKGKK
jgi:hypothetical protein